MLYSVIKTDWCGLVTILRLVNNAVRFSGFILSALLTVTVKPVTKHFLSEHCALCWHTDVKRRVINHRREPGGLAGLSCLNKHPKAVASTQQWWLSLQGAEGGNRRVVPGGTLQALWAGSSQQWCGQTDHHEHPMLWVWCTVPVTTIVEVLCSVWCFLSSVLLNGYLQAINPQRICRLTIQRHQTLPNPTDRGYAA